VPTQRVPPNSTDGTSLSPGQHRWTIGVVAIAAVADAGGVAEACGADETGEQDPTWLRSFTDAAERSGALPGPRVLAGELAGVLAGGAPACRGRAPVVISS
jgi:hypothetical protein